MASWKCELKMGMLKLTNLEIENKNTILKIKI